MITITISGRTGSGKTAIAQLINETLIGHGFAIAEIPEELSQRTHFVEHRPPDQLQAALATIADRETITIKEVCTRKILADHG